MELSLAKFKEKASSIDKTKPVLIREITKWRDIYSNNIYAIRNLNEVKFNYWECEKSANSPSEVLLIKSDKYILGITWKNITKGTPGYASPYDWLYVPEYHLGKELPLFDLYWTYPDPSLNIPDKRFPGKLEFFVGNDVIIRFLRSHKKYEPIREVVRRFLKIKKGIKNR